jgi:hypothetical protein
MATEVGIEFDPFFPSTFLDPWVSVGSGGSRGVGHGAMAPPIIIILEFCYSLVKLSRPPCKLTETFLSFYTLSHLFLNHHRYDDERW